VSFVSLWFLPLARQQDCILEYILPTKELGIGASLLGIIINSMIDTEFKGLSTMEIMNYLAPNVVTLGNHEMSQIELARSPKEKQLLSGNVIADKNLRQNYRSAIALCFL
jgi:hypothetical protein